MGVELQMLAWAVALGLVQLVIAATLATQQRGLGWNASARDGEAKPLTGVAARMDRALHNFRETFGFFAAAVLMVAIAQKTNAHTALGAQMYFWARVAYVPLYAAGVPYVRTLSWAVAAAGIVMVLQPLF
jgi:uncharacterized MAPEG superfamily protein